MLLTAIPLVFGLTVAPRATVRMATPQYTAQAAVVAGSRPVSPNGASWILSLRGLESDTAYAPGHVLAVEVAAAEGQPQLKGPYTVTRSDAAARTVDVIYRIITDEASGADAEHAAVGPLRKTAVFKALQEGDAGVSFGGSFKMPILDGVSAGARHVVLVTTGAGVGARPPAASFL